MIASNVIQLRQPRVPARAFLPAPAVEVADLAKYRDLRAGIPEGWPDGETGRKMEELAVWSFEHSIEEGRHDTMRDARVRTMRMVESLQRHFQERRNERG